MSRRIYLASSWRNEQQPVVLEALRSYGHEVYDHRNPPGRTGFQWSEIDPNWQQWTNQQYIDALLTPTAEAGFNSDYDAMQWADTGVLLLPSGRSAYLEAGYFNGARKPLHILLGQEQEPELMYLMATSISRSIDELVHWLATTGGCVMSRRERNEIDQAEAALRRGLVAALLLALGFSLLVGILARLMAGAV